MALSNILREPRREITESAVGITAMVAVLGIPIWLDYQFALWLQEVDHGCPLPLGMFAGVLCLIGAVLLFLFGWLMLHVTHEIGDSICTAFQRRGIHLRPRQRYN